MREKSGNIGDKDMKREEAVKIVLKSAEKRGLNKEEVEEYSLFIEKAWRTEYVLELARQILAAKID